MSIDLNSLSDQELEAISKGDLNSLSDKTLEMIAGSGQGEQSAPSGDRSFLDMALGGNVGAGVGAIAADIPNILFSIPNGATAGALRSVLNQPLAAALGGIPGASMTDASNVLPGLTEKIVGPEVAQLTGTKEPSPKSGIAPEPKTFAGSAISGQTELLSGALAGMALNKADSLTRPPLRPSADIQSELNAVQNQFDYTKDLARNSVKIEDARLNAEASVAKTGLQNSLQDITDQANEVGNQLTKNMRASRYWDYQRDLSQRYGAAVEPFLNEDTGAQIPVQKVKDALVPVYADKGIQYKINEGIKLTPEENAFNQFFERINKWQLENNNYDVPAGRLVSEFRQTMKPFQGKPWTSDLLTDVNHAMANVYSEYIPELKPINAQFSTEFKNRNTLRAIFQPFEKTTITDRGTKFIRDAATGNLANSPSKQEFVQWMAEKFPEDMAPVTKLASETNSLNQQSNLLDTAIQQSKAQNQSMTQTFLANKQAETVNKVGELNALLKEAQAREARNLAFKQNVVNPAIKGAAATAAGTTVGGLIYGAYKTTKGH